MLMRLFKALELIDENFWKNIILISLFTVMIILIQLMKKKLITFPRTNDISSSKIREAVIRNSLDN